MAIFTHGLNRMGRCEDHADFETYIRLFDRGFDIKTIADQRNACSFTMI